MPLLGGVTLLLAALLAVAAPVACYLMWDRPRRAPIRVGTRVVLLVLAQVTAVAAVGLAVNQNYGFYTSWSELFGYTAPATSTHHVAVVPVDSSASTRAMILADFQAHRGTVIPLTIPGSVSGVADKPGLLYLPPQYGDPAHPDVAFPVVELLGGVPSSPHSWIHAMILQRILDAAINAQQVSPFIAVMPTVNVAKPRDTECVNVVGGPQVDTYLTTDVHNAVERAVRAQQASTAWGVMGYSTGGYCAMNLAMRHPDLFQAAVSLSGYAAPYLDHTTGQLFGRSRTLYEQNSPLWEALHWSGHALNVLATASRQDTASVRDVLALHRVPNRPGLTIDVLIVPFGGHNFDEWAHVEPTAFAWLSQRLSPALAGTTSPGTITGPNDHVAVPPPIRHKTRRPGLQAIHSRPRAASTSFHAPPRQR